MSLSVIATPIKKPVGTRSPQKSSPLSPLQLPSIAAKSSHATPAPKTNPGITQLASPTKINGKPSVQASPTKLPPNSKSPIKSSTTTQTASAKPKARRSLGRQRKSPEAYVKPSQIRQRTLQEKSGTRDGSPVETRHNYALFEDEIITLGELSSLVARILVGGCSRDDVRELIYNVKVVGLGRAGAFAAGLELGVRANLNPKEVLAIWNSAKPPPITDDDFKDVHESALDTLREASSDELFDRGQDVEQFVSSLSGSHSNESQLLKALLDPNDDSGVGLFVKEVSSLLKIEPEMEALALKSQGAKWYIRDLHEIYILYSRWYQATVGGLCEFLGTSTTGSGIAGSTSSDIGRLVVLALRLKARRARDLVYCKSVLKTAGLLRNPQLTDGKFFEQSDVGQAFSDLEFKYRGDESSEVWTADELLGLFSPPKSVCDVGVQTDASPLVVVLATSATVVGGPTLGAERPKSQKEITVQKRLESETGGKHAKTPFGRIVDIITSDELIEIKNWNAWRKAIPQLWAYSRFFSGKRLRLHFFGVRPRTAQLALAEAAAYRMLVSEEVNGVTVWLLRDQVTSPLVGIHDPFRRAPLSSVTPSLVTHSVVPFPNLAAEQAEPKESWRAQTKTEIQAKIASRGGGKVVKLAFGRVVDVVTATELFNIEHWSKWRDTIPHLWACSPFYPLHQLRLHFFGERPHNADLAIAEAGAYNMMITDELSPQTILTNLSLITKA